MNSAFQKTKLSRSTTDLPGNWFIEGDGTCGDPPDSSLSTQGSFIGFFVLTFLLAAMAGVFNFNSLLKEARKTNLFKHGLYKQTIIDVAASTVAPILAATVFKQDGDVYTWHNFHVIAWVVLFGFRPGAIMGIIQVFRNDTLTAAAAAGQMIPDILFPIVGCAVVLGSETGSVVPVAYGQYRTAVFVGVSFLLVHFLILICLYLRYWAKHNNINGEEQYGVFTHGWGRTFVFILGILSVVGSSVLLIVGSKLCGKLTTFIDAMCQVLQVLLSAITACWVRD